MNDFSNNFRIILRLCVLAGVLAGLCFSSSEGVRLLPFPTSATGERRGDDVSLGAGTIKAYSLSVHNSAVKLVKNGGNVQNNTKFFARAHTSFHKPRFAELLRDRGVRNKREPIFFKPTALTAAPSERAPPVV